MEVILVALFPVLVVALAGLYFLNAGAKWYFHTKY